MRISSHFILVCCLFLQLSGIHAQNFDKLYPEIFNQLSSSASTVLPEPDGSFLVLMHDLAGGDGNYALVNINAQGEIMWRRHYTPTGVSLPNKVIRNADGGLTYLLTQVVNGQFDLKFVRVNALYDPVSESSLGSPQLWEYAIDILGKSGTDEYWACQYNGSDTARGGLRLLDGAGNDLIAPVFTGLKNLYPVKLLPRPDGGVQVIGFGKPVNSDTSRILINQHGPNGAFLSQRAYGLNELGNRANDAILTADGGMILSGSTSKPFLQSLDPQGNVRWTKTYTPASNLNVELVGIVPKTDGTGYRLIQNSPLNIMEIDLDGNLLWRKAYPGNAYTRGRGHLILPDGGSLIVGEKSEIQSLINPWIIRTDSAGTVFSSGCSGKLTLDLDMDCLGDSDSLMASKGVQFYQNGQLVNFTQADNSGNYNIGLTPGSYVLKIKPYNPLWSSCPDSLNVQILPDSIVNIPDIALINGEALMNSIQGQLYKDLDGDCQADSLEYLAYANWPVFLSLYASNGIFYSFQTLTDSTGHYLFDNLENTTNGFMGDIYTINPGGNGLDCNFTCQQTYFIPPFGALDLRYDFALACDSLPPCPILDVSLASWPFRPCLQNNIVLNYCNVGRELLANAQLDVQIDTNLTVVSIDYPYTDLGNNHYLINLPLINSGSCGQIMFLVSVPCDDPAGTTYCSSVYGYPDSVCTDTINQLWDGSEIKVTGSCVGNQVVFLIENIGTGNMTAPLGYIVVEDNVLMMSAPFQLNAGQSIEVAVPADGSFYRLETQQSPGAPGLSQPVVWVEGCPNNGIISLGWVNQYYLGDPEPWYDVYCQESVNSFDPNDKQGYPLGLGAAHHIKPNTELEYLIRFQNTGTAPALYVEIRDTLPLDQLDALSVRPGPSSHGYTWDMQGNGVVVFKFFDINLPDSLSDPEGSNGFVQFKVKQKKDLTPGTIIHNDAAIYFDNNAPVITNETEHVIQTNILLSGIRPLTSNLPGLDIQPNPSGDETWLHLEAPPVQALFLTLQDLTGRTLRNIRITSTLTRLDLEGLPKGVYTATLSQEGHPVGAGRLVKL